MSLRSNQSAAFTFVDFCTVAAVILLAVVVFARTSIYCHPISKRVVCNNNLRQVVLAQLMFKEDNNQTFSCNSSTNNGGGAEFLVDGDLGRYYQSIFDYIKNNQVFTCPADKRLRSTNRYVLQNSNVSYFAAITPLTKDYTGALIGDRNLAWNNRALVRRITLLRPADTLTFTSGIHTNVGCVATADGRVAVVTNIVASSTEGHELPKEIVLPFVSE